MRVSVKDAEAQLTELVLLAEVILTHEGRPAVRLVPVRAPLSREERLAVIREIQAEAAKNALPGPDAAHSADFLYDEHGLPA